MRDLVFFKLGRAVRYRYGDVLAFMDTRKATSTLAARNIPHPRRSECDQLALRPDEVQHWR